MVLPKGTLWIKIFLVKPYRWSAEKDQKLRSERGLGFEEAVKRLQEGGLLDMIRHPDQRRFPHQHVYVFEKDGDIWCMPFVEDANSLFLKTIYRSRKLRKKYGGQIGHENQT
jgi:hypothetical protein